MIAFGPINGPLRFAGRLRWPNHNMGSSTNGTLGGTIFGGE
jgi:hypothetical protein